MLTIQEYMFERLMCQREEKRKAKLVHSPSPNYLLCMSTIRNEILHELDE
jgi:hypothetical protein